MAQGFGQTDCTCMSFSLKRYLCQANRLHRNLLNRLQRKTCFRQQAQKQLFALFPLHLCGLQKASVFCLCQSCLRFDFLKQRFLAKFHPVVKGQIPVDCCNTGTDCACRIAFAAHIGLPSLECVVTNVPFRPEILLQFQQVASIPFDAGIPEPGAFFCLQKAFNPCLCERLNAIFCCCHFNCHRTHTF